MAYDSEVKCTQCAYVLTGMIWVLTSCIQIRGTVGKKYVGKRAAVSDFNHTDALLMELRTRRKMLIITVYLTPYAFPTNTEISEIARRWRRIKWIGDVAECAPVSPQSTQLFFYVFPTPAAQS